MTVRYPGESHNYRSARDKLLQEEVSLRAQTERVAQLRRNLPDGGPLKEDYEFTNLTNTGIRFSGLFTGGRNVLALYSLMYKPQDQAPCPMCVSLLDGLNGQARHIGQLMRFAVVSAASPAQLSDLANRRGWSDLDLLSARGTGYQSDYNAQAPDGAQLPMINIFRKTPAGISHFWGSESFFADIDGHARHLDQLWPLWNMLDLTPAGRGTDWYPGL